MYSEEYTLVCVDMQSNYPAANDPGTIRAVQREVVMARDNGCAVVFLWVPGWGIDDAFPRTHRSIRDLVDGYERHCEAPKSAQWGDGSPVVLGECERRGYSTERYRVVGVNTCFCVHGFVQGLRKRKPHAVIELVQDACNTAYGPTGSLRFTEDEVWAMFEPLNVDLVHVETDALAV